MKTSFALGLVLSLAAPAVALAQDAAPHHARAGAQLALADEELKLLYAVLTAKVFDVDLSKSLMSDLKRAVSEAKSSSFRASALSDDAKLESGFKKLQDALKRTEDATSSFDASLKSETAGVKPPEEESDDIAPAAGSRPSEAKMPSWDILKDAAGALAKELAETRAAHSAIAKQLKMPVLKAPPPPKKK